MKTAKTFITSLSILAFIFAIGISGCKKQASTTNIVAVCDTLVCHNGGTCASGTCVCGGHFAGRHCDSCQSGFRGAQCDSCILGYEGANCNTLSSAKFVGSYVGSDTCSGAVYADTWIISAVSGNLTQLQVAIGGAAVALLVNFSGNTFTIPSQSHSGLTFNSGSGTVNGNNIVITYNYTNSSTTQTCTFGGTK